MKKDNFLSINPHGFHRISYVSWPGGGQRGHCLCVHGLTRNGRDFDALAQGIAPGYRAVACPDVVGRGESDWLSHAEDYDYRQYVTDMTVLLARLGAREVDWIGTSMGGLIGMMAAAQPGTPVRRLVLNDIGAFIPAKALARLAAYVGKAPVFESLETAEAYFRRVYGSFGALEDAQWAHLVRHGVRRTEAGAWTLTYDPAIARAFTPNAEGEFDDVDLWDLWAHVRCPTLILRGESSDILSEDCARRMVRGNPYARWVEIPDTGHAPALMAADQIAIVRDWLEE